MTDKKNTYKVFTTKIANALCKKGYRVIGTTINNQKPWLNVFLFEDTPELREDIQRLTKKEQ